jgi:hypothetical protein
MRTQYILTGLIVTILTICSCEKENTIETDAFTISYSKGSSWGSYSYDATIDQNGFMHVTETNGLTKTNRKSEYRLVDTDLNMIKEKLNNVINLNMLDKYGFDNENAPTDLPTTTLTYKTTIKSDSVSIYFPNENELPSDLDSFLQTVEGVILNNDTLINK